ncbi:MAG: RNA 3'-terminal phosphate cyclase [Candidatus Kariarchaeaceae archaeon]
MYHIDGSSGGGSILRVAIPIALAQRRDINITNIRKGRSTPGLRTQHLAGIELICKLTGSLLKGGKVGSEEINIVAGSDALEETDIDISTAGSLSLIYQLLSNYCMVAETRVRINFNGGGTHTQWSPNFDYLEQVTIPAFQAFGQKAELTVERFGYYPKGGARGQMTIEQVDPAGQISWDNQPLENISLISRASQHLREAQVAERQALPLKDNLNINTLHTQYDTVSNPGSAITAWMRSENMYRGYSTLGRKGLPAEKVGRVLLDQIRQASHAPVDEYLADQLIVPLSQSGAGSYYAIPKMTDHVGTNFNLVNYLLKKTIRMKQEKGVLMLEKT